MGGSAFANAVADGHPTLRTPRLSPAEYQKLRDIYLERCRGYFTGCQVAQLQEAPEKIDYGDIDILVGCHQNEVQPAKLAQSVGAIGYIPNGPMCMLAVRRDGTRHDHPPVRYTLKQTKAVEEPRDGQSHDEYAHIDVNTIDPDSFAWHSFYTSYGDLAGILGQILCNLGFTISDQGLALRLAELDDAKHGEIPYRIDDRQGKILLSSSPDHVMDFLGLDRATFHAGFVTMHDFYSWLASCRLMTASYVHSLAYKRRDVHRQRKKELKRHMITNFLTEFLPQYLSASERHESYQPGSDATMLRPELSTLRQRCANEAMKFFDKVAQYTTLRDNLVVDIANQTAEYLLKPIVQRHYTGVKPQEIVKGLRRGVAFSAGRPYLLNAPQADENSQLRHWLDGHALKDPVATDAWIAENWVRCQGLARVR